MQTRRVVVEEYDPNWPDDFAAIEGELAAEIGDICIEIEHVGSTAVPGLAAKPIIDIDVVVASGAQLGEAIERLAGIGYIYEGDLGIADRHAFRYAGKSHLRAHHLYVCPQFSAELRRHIAFRDYLRAHPEAALEYGRIKMEGARLFPNDIGKYIEHKSEFIKGIYEAIRTE